MKNSKLIAAFIFIVCLHLAAKAQPLATINAESGNRATDQANCWGFGTFNTSNLSVIAGSYSYRGNATSADNIGNCWIKSPWCKFTTGGNITLKAKIDASNGTYRKLIFSYYTYDATKPYGQGTLVRFDSMTWGNYTPIVSSTLPTTVQNISVPLPAAIISNSSVFSVMISAVGSGGSSRWILDDINIPAIYWSNPSNSCMALALIVDADGDGVQDSDDAYPNDSARAYNNYYPPSGFGTLLFEDLWPSLGDYDFNDLVLAYRTNKVTNANSKVVELKATYVIRAIGAGKSNGFGIQLDNLNPSKITGVTGVKTNSAAWLSVGANGTENGQTSANVIVYDDVNRLMPNPGGSCINTYTGNTYVTPDTTDIVISFNTATGQAITVSDISLNPYLIVNQERGKEVHLANKVPTLKASSSYFGTLQDNTNIGTGVYYKSKVNNLPWALDIPAAIPYMREKIDFINGYLFFVDWAESEGIDHANWYLNTNSSRNLSNFY